MEATKVVPQRVAAWIVDALIFFAFEAALFFALADSDTEIREKLVRGEIDLTATTYGNVTIGDSEYAIVGGTFWLWFLIVLAAGIAYFWVLPGKKGWTPGKALLGLRIVRDDMTCPPGVGKSAVRNLLWVVDGFPYFIPLVGFIVALTNKRNKRVGDMVAGTLVVKKEYANQGAAAATGAEGSPAALGPQSPGGGFSPTSGAPPATPVPAAPAAPAAPSAQAADWYPDPKGEKRLRYWDGQSWTDHVAD